MSPRLPFRLVYHDGYDLNLGDHVFPSQKYRLIRARMLADDLVSEHDFDAPAAAAAEDLLLVHDAGWVQRLERGTLTYEEILRLEVPYSRQMVQAFKLAAGGTTLAARNALRDGVSYNVGGGFHHAFPGHGEGFCAIHDVAVAIRVLQRDGMIRKALVIDLDNHHGNGTAAIFQGDRTVMTISMHQFRNYPHEKPPSTIDVHLEDGTGDTEYLRKLSEVYRVALPGFKPDIVFYVAGADPYCEDQLGGLNLTLEGLKQRDAIVFETSLTHHVPVVVTLAGGYAYQVEDTVTIHVNTAKAAAQALLDIGYRQRMASS